MKWLTAVAAGLALAASMPGPSAWPLAFVALAPWAWATRRGGFRVDYLTGLGFFAPTVFFLARITWAAYLPTVVLAPLFVALAGWVYRSLRGAMPSALALPLAWITGEAARSYFLPARFPWDLLGYAAAGWLDLAGLASLGGPLLLSAVFAASNGAIADAWDRRTWRPVVLAALALAPLVLVGGWLRRAVGELAPGPMVACVQPNVPQELKSLGVPWSQVSKDIQRLAGEGARAGADVVVLPETMFLPFVASDDAPPGATLTRPYLERPLGLPEIDREERRGIAELRQAIGPKPWLVVGALGLDPRMRLQNSALLYDPDGRRRARYDKLHLVPGSEQLPLLGEGRLGDAVKRWIDEVSGGMVPELVPGDRVVVFEAAGARFGVSVCYDNVFPDLFRDAARQGAQFHLVLSNEGWFPGSFELDAMLAFSAFRAIETRRAVLRCTNTGVSCVIGPDGVLLSALEREVQGVFSARPPLGSRRTVYLAVGDLPALLAAAGALLFALARRAARRLDPPSSADKLARPSSLLHPAAP
ncbi:MAG TPA: apolipoprotein N-acyltransferase [Planctomycetota bacterium]|nr:apolipoprotein N-acyltransferase [Planctomycetota bacterium]